MKFIKKIAILFFDLIDKYFHQKRILNFIRNESINLECFFDVGSHMGTYSDLILGEFSNCKTYMFEPQFHIFKKIKKKYKNQNNVKIFNFAISNKLGKKKFNINKHDLTSSLTSLDFKNNRYLQLKARLFGTNSSGMVLQKKNIQTKKLSQFIKSKKIRIIDLVKVDTEGHELEVLEGLGKDIKNIRYILIEFHNDKIYLSYKPKKIHNLLINNNFELKKRYHFPFTTWEDRFYFNNRFK